MSTLPDAILQVQTYVRALAGIRAAPDYPPDKLDPFPFAVAFPGAGAWEWGATGAKKGLHTIVLEVHVARKDLPRDVLAVLPFVESVPNLLMSKFLNDNKWNGKIDSFERISYTFGPLGWNGVETIGYKFQVENVKIQSAIT